MLKYKHVYFKYLFILFIYLLRTQIIIHNHIHMTSHIFMKNKDYDLHRNSPFSARIGSLKNNLTENILGCIKTLYNTIQN